MAGEGTENTKHLKAEALPRQDQNVDGLAEACCQSKCSDDQRDEWEPQEA